MVHLFSLAQTLPLSLVVERRSSLALAQTLPLLLVVGVDLDLGLLLLHLLSARPILLLALGEGEDLEPQQLPAQLQEEEGLHLAGQQMESHNYPKHQEHQEVEQCSVWVLPPAAVLIQRRTLLVVDRLSLYAREDARSSLHLSSAVSQ